MQQFLESNWLSILSIFVGIIVAFVFYRLQRKDSISASTERKKHANVEILDVIESYLINKQELSESIIENLIEASERAHLVTMRPDCTPISLLQDAALRLQRSRHLDILQKSEYSDKIHSLITAGLARREPLNWNELNTQFISTSEEIEALVPDPYRTDVREKLNYLAAIFSRHKKVLSPDVGITGSALPILSAITVGVAASFAASNLGKALGKASFESNSQEMVMVGIGCAGLFGVLGVLLWRIRKK